MEKLYSGKQVEKAGVSLGALEHLLADSEKFEETMNVLSYWRSSHEEPLDLAVKILDQTVLKKDKSAIFAKRLKRYISIVKKLDRFKEMSLKNMQDIGGCRAIVANEKKLRQSVRDLKKLEFFKGENKKYRYKDYIQDPKDDGYRSYHLVGKFPDRSGNLKSIEVQLRTRIQHCWATSLEIVDLFTDQALKSNEGDPVWKDFFILISEQFALMEGIHLFDQLSPQEMLKKYSQKLREKREYVDSCYEAKRICSKLKVAKKLSAFSGSLKVIDERLGDDVNPGYALLKINTVKLELESTLFLEEQSEEAENAYTEAEKKFAKSDGMVVALVSSSAVGGIRQAYPNYFADSSEFAKYLSLVVSVKI